MNQLTQNLKSGKMELLETPFPAMTDGKVLVRTYYSLISAGTEGGKVKTARSSLINKAKQKPEQVRQVIDTLKSEGLQSTYQKVMNKLDAPAPLGYSCAGEVIDVGRNVRGFQVGDLVACGGAEAAHAELAAVPENLCVKVPKGVKLEHAAFTTVASIALQGIRQADLRVGESCAVIGLGLIGQLTVQILKVSGAKVAGIDIDPDMVALAKKSGADVWLERHGEGLEEEIAELSGGFGVDAVIITAGTSSLDPVELAGRLCRKKGKVVIVGAVPTGFSRPNYYKKELDLRMSSSYGPGRYDDDYEQKGVDYPIGYVRWTENRNMQAFLDLVKAGKLNIDLLITHRFDFKDALDAYELILKKSEPVAGILLKYDTDKKLAPFVEVHQPKVSGKALQPQVGFIGAGSFAQKFLLPNAKKYSRMVAVATAVGHETRNAADKYGFQFASGEAEDVIHHQDVNTVFIATRHDSHADYVLKCLNAGKNVFVEKPLCMTEDELEQIKAEYEKKRVHLMVGFNRRFAPLLDKVMQKLHKNTLKATNYRINVGKIPADHWTQDPDVGGGRIVGEVCHFVDLCMYISGSKPVLVHASAMDTAQNLNDTLVVNLKFENGSVATISYFANGSKKLEKEYLEIYSNGMTAVLHDFKRLEFYGNKKEVTKSTQDKGHAEEVKQFLKAVEKGLPTPIPFEDVYLSSLIPFKILESIRSGKAIRLR